MRSPMKYSLAPFPSMPRSWRPKWSVKKGPKWARQRALGLFRFGECVFVWNIFETTSSIVQRPRRLHPCNARNEWQVRWKSPDQTAQIELERSSAGSGEKEDKREAQTRLSRVTLIKQNNCPQICVSQSNTCSHQKNDSDEPQMSEKLLRRILPEDKFTVGLIFH